MDISAQTPSLDTAQSRTPPASDAAVAKTYLAEFLEAHPQWQTALAEAGIKSDATYLRHEARLTPRCRAALGYYRMVALAGGVDQDDPIRIAKAAPPWLQSRTLVEENLAMRARNTLSGAGFVTIGDLSHLGSLSEIKGLGQVGMRDITRLLRGLLRLKEGDNERRYLDLCGFDEVIDSPSFWAAIEVGLTHNYAREINILRKRLALDGERWTLQDTANLFNVTRERVRQIEASALRRITANRNWSRFINGKLSALLAHRTTPMSLADAAQRDPWFADLASRVAAIPLVLEYLLQSDVKMLTIEETQYLGYLSPEDWHVARTTAIERLTEAQSRDDAPVLDDAACSALAGAVLPDNAKEFTALLWCDIKPAFQFGTDAAGRDVLLVAGTSTRAKVLAILEQARAPLHYSEIARQIDERSGGTIDVRLAHNVAASVGLLLGQGIYGLEKHLPYDAETRARILHACESIVQDGPVGRIWHIEEILKALLGEQPLVLGDIDLSILTNYTLNIIMKKSGSMVDLGRFVWQKAFASKAAPSAPAQEKRRKRKGGTAAAGSGATSAKASRINLNELITEILEKAGHPLSIQDLRSRVRERRGTRDEMLLHQGDSIIRVGPKLWGINDRDTPIKRPDQPALVERVHEHLSRTQKGIKLSEVCALFDVPPGCPPEIVFSLALTDPRFRVGPGRYLMLRDWNDPGRLTVLQAVQRVLSSATRPIPLDKINAQVNELMGEDVPRRGISTLLRAAGGELLDDGRWRDGKRGATGRKRPVRGSSNPATGGAAA